MSGSKQKICYIINVSKEIPIIPIIVTLCLLFSSRVPFNIHAQIFLTFYHVSMNKLILSLKEGLWNSVNMIDMLSMKRDIYVLSLQAKKCIRYLKSIKLRKVCFIHILKPGKPKSDSLVIICRVTIKMPQFQ